MSNAQKANTLVRTGTNQRGSRLAVTDMELQNLISFADKTPDDSTEIYVERKGSESYLWYK